MNKKQSFTGKYKHNNIMVNNCDIYEILQLFFNCFYIKIINIKISEQIVK